jgi:hypothetical protein
MVYGSLCYTKAVINEQRTIQGVKRKEKEARIGDKYVRKKFDVVIEELTVMNSFLIPLLHMLAKIA